MNTKIALTPPFVRRLHAAFLNNSEASRGLYIASTDVDPLHRMHLVLAAMRRNAPDMRKSLMAMMRDRTLALADCASAGKLFLEGFTLGHWVAAPQEVAMARGLISACFGEEPPAPKPEPKAAPASPPPPPEPPAAATAAPGPKRKPPHG